MNSTIPHLIVHLGLSKKSNKEALESLGLLMLLLLRCRIHIHTPRRMTLEIFPLYRIDLLLLLNEMALHFSKFFVYYVALCLGGIFVTKAEEDVKVILRFDENENGLLKERGTFVFTGGM